MPLWPSTTGTNAAIARIDKPPLDAAFQEIIATLHEPLGGAARDGNERSIARVPARGIVRIS